MKKLPNKKFLFDQLGNAYINGEKVGRVVVCVEVGCRKYIKLPARGYFTLKVNETKKDARKMK